MEIFGQPLFGFWLPFIGVRRIPLNADGSVVDTGKADIVDEVGFYFVDQPVFEWLGKGFGIAPGDLCVTATGQPANPLPDWATGG